MGIQIIPQAGSISGRLGKGIGQGLSEQVPKEIDRYRLSEGLKDFEKNYQGLTPIQQLTKISSIPGITHQMIQSFTELAKQQAQGQALNSRNQTDQPSESPKKFPENPSDKKQGNEPPKSITTKEPVKATIENYIPKTYDQILDRAGQLYNSNPGLYKNDANNAIQAATQEDSQNQSINQAQQNKRKTQQDVQSRVQSELKDQASKAGVKIPDNVYSQIEDDAIDSVNSGEMTELEAAKHYKKELDSISRDYQVLKTIGTGKLISTTPSSNKKSIKSVRDKFDERDDLENFTDTLVAENGLTYPKASYLGYPISKNKELNNHFARLKDIGNKTSFEKGYPEHTSTSGEDRIIKTMGEALKILPLIKPTDSFFAISEELASRGYDPEVAMDYFDKNRKKVKGLTAVQNREFEKPRSFVPSIDDLWMFYFSGLDKIVEQK